MKLHQVLITYNDKHLDSAGRWRASAIITVVGFWLDGNRGDIETISVDSQPLNKETAMAQLLVMGIYYDE